MPFKFVPGCPAVDRTVKSAPRAAAVQAPRGSPGLPQRRKQDIRVTGIENNINAAAFRVLIKNLFPCLAAILRAKNAAFFIVRKRMSERSNEGDIWILWIHRETPNGMRVGKADELPCFARIDRLVNTVAADDVAADTRFARPHINDIRIGLSNGDRSNCRRRILLFIENGFPTEPAIGRLPHAPGNCAKIIDIILANYAGDSDDASAAERTDEPILHPFPRSLILIFCVFLSLGGRRAHRFRLFLTGLRTLVRSTFLRKY
jgi:hypothetical protein